MVNLNQIIKCLNQIISENKPYNSWNVVIMVKCCVLGMLYLYCADTLGFLYCQISFPYVDLRQTKRSGFLWKIAFHFVEMAAEGRWQPQTSHFLVDLSRIVTVPQLGQGIWHEQVEDFYSGTSSCHQKRLLLPPVLLKVTWNGFGCTDHEARGRKW